MKKLVFFLMLSSILIGLEKIYGQVNISVGNTITENFSIGTTATASLPANWKVDKNTTARLVGAYSSAVTQTEQRSGNSMSATAGNGIYNYAAGDPTSATDRAIGGLSSGSASKSVNVYVQLKNNGSSEITDFTISYIVEKYRNGQNAAGFSIQMYYSTNGTSWTSAGSDFLSSFPADADNNGYASAPGSTANVSNKTLTLSVPSNGIIYLAWNYSVTSGTTTSSAQGLGIDNVSITANGNVATPSLSVSALADFGTQCTGGVYGPNSFTITGSNLTAANVTVGALNGYSYSTTSGGVYTSTLSVAPSSGSVNQDVFVKFSPVLGQSYNGDIVVGGGGSTDVNRSVTGSGTGAISAEVSSQAANGVGNTTATLNANLTILGTCPNTTEKGFVYSLTSENSNPLVSGSGVTKITVAGISIGSFNKALTSLVSNSSYSFKAYVYDGSSYTYGSVLTFTTTTPASKLVFGTLPPASGFVNTNLSTFTVEAQRIDNTIDTEFNGDVTIAKASGSGAIAGTLTVTATNGIATFNAIQFNATDTYTINASATGLTNVTSGNIVIGSAPTTLAAWNFNGQSSPVSFAATTYHANLINAASQSNITRGAGAASSAGSNSFRTTGFQNNGVSTANTDFFQVTLTPANGFELSLSTIDAVFVGTNTYYNSPGVTSQFAYSIDGTNFTLIGSPVTSTSLTLGQINVSAISQLQNIPFGTTVTLRYYASGQTTTGGWGFSSPNASTDGLKIGGNIIVSAAVPALTVSENVLNDFAYIFNNGPSAEQSFTLSGSDLTHNVSVVPPANYEISTVSGVGFTPTNPIQISPSSGNVNQIIYVRLKSGLAIGAFDNQVIQISSTNASDKTVTLNGDVFKTAPTTQSSNIVFASTGSNSINLNWTIGNGENRIVKINTSNSFTNPVDGNVYSANSVYAAGEQVIYNNSSNTVTVTGLNPTTTYWFRVYEYNNVGVFTNYNTATETNNPLSKTTTLAPWENFEIGTKASYTAGSVVCSAGSWYMSDALIGTSASDRKNGSQSIRVQNVGYIQTNFDITDGIGTVTVSHARYGSDAIASWLLKVSNDGGATWTAFESDPVESSVATLQTTEFTVNLTGNLRIRLEKIAGGNRINWDDIFITHFTAVAHDWTGSVSTNWSTAGNWNPATIPTIAEDVVIPNVANKPIIASGTNAVAKNININNGSTLTISQGGTLTVAQTLTNNGTLTSKSNASGDGSLITNTLAGSGSYKIERYLSSGKWHLISSPISSATSAIFNGVWLRPYNEATNAYGSYISSTSQPLIAGQGYSVWTNNSETRTFTGVINNGSVGPIALPRTNQGWNLIGNPYPSAIDVDAASGWTKTNVGSAIYIWDNNQYKVYLSSTGDVQAGISANGGTRYIAAGQGFFVQAMSGGSSISMNNSVRVHNTTPFLKNEDAANIIRVKVANENFSDEAVFVIRQESMDEFDPWFDASKLRGSGLTPQLYSKKGTEEMTISTFNNLDKLYNRNVFFEPAELTEHVIIYSHTLDGNLIPRLYDNVNQTFIYPNVPYVFTPSESDIIARFEFKEPNTTGVNESDLSQIMIWQSNKKLYIQNLDNEIIREIKVFDIQGRLVFTGNQNVSDLSFLTSSTYIVKLNTDHQNLVKKIVIR